MYLAVTAHVKMTLPIDRCQMWKISERIESNWLKPDANIHSHNIIYNINPAVTTRVKRGTEGITILGDRSLP